MSLRKELRDFMNSAWPWIIAGVIALGWAFLTACTTPHFDGPLPAPFQSPAEYTRPQSKDGVICWYERDSVAWLMRVPRNECAGHAPI